MSTRRGNTKKQGQKHQNVTAFKDYKGCTIYKKIKALPNEGLCEKCHDIIEWKKKYYQMWEDYSNACDKLKEYADEEEKRDQIRNRLKSSLR